MVAPQPKLRTETDRQLMRRYWFVIAFLVTLFAVNFIQCWFFTIGTAFNTMGLLAYFTMGIVAGEIVLLSLLFALFPASLWMRILLTIVAAVAVWTSIIFGEAVFGYWFFTGELFSVDVFPLTIFCGALPFLLARHWMCWELTFKHERNIETTPLSVADLMLVTAVAALAIVFVTSNDPGLVPRKLIVAGAWMGVSFAVLVPLTFWLMKWPRKWLTLVGCTLLVLSVGLFLVWNFTSIRFQLPYRVAVGVVVSITSMTFCLGIGLIVLRHAGGELQTAAGGTPQVAG